MSFLDRFWFRAAAKPKVEAPPTSTEMQPPDLYDLQVYTSGQAITPAELRTWIQQAEGGEPGQLYAFYDEARARDAHLDSELAKAEQLVAGARIDVLPYPASLRSRAQAPTGEAARSVEVAAYVSEVLLAPEVQLDRAVGGLMDGFWKGLGALSLTVEAQGKRERVVSLDPVPAQRFRWDMTKGTQELLVQTSGDRNSAVPVEDLGSGLVVFQPESHVPSPARRGILRRCLGVYVIRAYGPEWWSRYVEVFGSPFRIGKYPRGDVQTKALLSEVLKLSGTAGWAAVPDGTSLELHDVSRGTGESPHERILDWTGRELSKLILGATQTTDVQVGAGSKASATVHQEVVIQRASARARSVAACLRSQLVQPLVERAFGPEVAALYTPELVFRVESKPSQLEAAQTLKALVEAGLRVPEAAAYELVGLPVPEPGEPTVEKAAPVVAPPQGEPAEEERDEDELEPEEASVRRPANGIELPALERRAERLAQGAGEEVAAPFRELIDQAVKDGATPQQLLARVLQRATLPVEAPKLMDLLAAVQLEAIMRGIDSVRRERWPR